MAEAERAKAEAERAAATRPDESATMPPSIRPAPMRVYEKQVIDLRQDLEDEHGRFLPLHMDDPSRFDVVSIATRFPGLQENNEKGKYDPCNRARGMPAYT